ncbi:hypothetical protein NQ317_014951 [Molorchus minor]|uniref:Uncharacterized protein n=1 Tax=Molorchus minor TaxID=1323400 RepID=A0ABQ9JYR7_9CUCU|nr:hypothetical protein NQ317_014951 [Molorchus minor]
MQCVCVWVLEQRQCEQPPYNSTIISTVTPVYEGRSEAGQAGRSCRRSRRASQPGRFVILVIVTVEVREIENNPAKMPVRTPDDVLFSAGLMDDMSVLQPVIDVDALYPNTEPLLSDDIWKKFELDFPELAGFDDIFDDIVDTVKTESSLFPFLGLEGICEIRNHDCMWAGHCASKEHPADEPRAYAAVRPPTFAPAPIMRPPAPPKPQTAKQPSQQSLLKPAVRAAACTHVPQTPPMSDDEEVRSKPTKVLQILNQTISECDLEDDSDIEDESGLKEYFGYGDDADVEVTLVEVKDEEEEEMKKNIRKYQYAAESDHSYHKDKNASMRMASLGIDTPSDSGE